MYNSGFLGSLASRRMERDCSRAFQLPRRPYRWVADRLARHPPWYRRLIQIEKGQTKLVQAELDIERRQKEGLRQAVLELKQGAQS